MNEWISRLSIPLHRTGLVGAAACLTITLLATALTVPPRYARVQALRKSVQKEQAEVDRLRSQASTGEVSGLAKENEGIEARLRDRFPSSKWLPLVIGEVLRAASRYQLDEVQVSVIASANKGELVSLPVKPTPLALRIEFISGYTELVGFLDAVRHLPGYLSEESLDLKRESAMVKSVVILQPWGWES